MVNNSKNLESDRLEALKRFSILDTDQEQLYDDFTQLAAQICDTPISLMSLVDEDRQWFKAKVGLSLDQTPRQVAFCAQAIAQPQELLIVKNALEDERFANNPLVTGEPHIRSYVGAPLVTNDGYAIGTLCVIDQKPRELSPEQLSALRTLARQVVLQLDAQLNVKLLNDLANQLEVERQETQLILDSVPAYVFFKDTKNNILRVNKPVMKLLDADASELEGHSTSEFYPELSEELYRGDLEAIQSKQPTREILERLGRDQSERWIRTDRIPIASRTGEIERLLIVSEDITDLKASEESLRKSQAELSEVNAHLEELVKLKTAELEASKESYEDLYENSPDIHISIDARKGCVLQCNQTYFRETGFAPDDVIGKHIFELYHPCCHDLARKALEQFRQHGWIKNAELVLIRNDGSQMEIILNSSAIRNASGEIVASRSTLRDITDKKRLEQEIKNNAEQLSHLARVATMNEMATGIAHELNQPLHAIKNYAQGALIRLKNNKFEPSFLTALFQDIVTDADRAAELIKSFRRFVKPSQKHSARVQPEELVSRLSTLLARELESCGAELLISVDESTPAVLCDTVQIKQVLLNLILNARDAIVESAPDDKTIQVRIEPTADNTVQFSVMDRGTGFAQMDAEKMFDAFYTTKENGLGMGLAICRTIVQTHGGELTVSENEGAGLIMAFTLPAAPIELERNASETVNS